MSLHRRSTRTWDCLLLAALALFFCWFFVGRFGIFGSKVDWISQHSVIPDYFRQQFYDTGELFPEFAANIGGGQNIYNFAYYGLYSPVILFSYLLPFVKMGDYIMISSVCMVALSAVIFYCWLLKRNFSRSICFFSALMLVLAGPVIFHSARHIMFINYMPFLCMALWGIDVYLGDAQKAGKRVFGGSPWLYIISVFLMILTSFYFSIGGMLVLCVYGLHRYLEKKEEYVMQGCKKEGFFSGLAGFGADAVRFLVPMITAVLMSAFLLVPTAAALLGKRETARSLDVAALFTPDFSAFRLMYSSYGIGLTAFMAVVLIAGLAWRKWSSRILVFSCIVVLTVPFFAWVLNGGLYPRDKALIPFLPLLIYMTACYYRRAGLWLDASAGGRLDKKRCIWGSVPYVAVILLLIRESGYTAGELTEAAGSLISQLMKGGLIGSVYQWLLLISDSVLMLLCYVLFCTRKKLFYLMAAPVLFLAVFGVSFHGTANIESREFYSEVTDEQIEKAVQEVLSQEEGFYRMEQYGTYTRNMANVNRIWDMGQYISSVYSSSYNDEYKDFCTGTFGIEEPTRNFLIQQVSQNPAFQKLMGVKYLVTVRGGISEQQTARLATSGYELCYEEGGVSVYRNDAVNPVCYMADRTIAQAEYEALTFPYSQAALNHYTVTEEGDGSSAQKAEEELEDCVKKAELTFDPQNVTGFLAEGDSWYVNTDAKQTLSARIQSEHQKEGGSYVLYLQFEVKNLHPSRELSVSVEGVQNKLSSSTHLYDNGNTVFTYALPLMSGQEEVTFSFGKGEYQLLHVEAYTEALTQLYADQVQDEFIVDQDKTKGNRLSGTIRAEKTGYLVTSIPYDENFEVRIDGKRSVCSRVNTAFVGVLVAQGEHEIELIYHAPGLETGKMLAGLGFCLFMLQLLWGFGSGTGRVSRIKVS